MSQTMQMIVLRTLHLQLPWKVLLGQSLQRMRLVVAQPLEIKFQTLSRCSRIML